MLAKRTNLLIGLMATLLALGCSEVTPAPTEVPGPGPDENLPPPPAPTPEPCAKIDFLFVVDDSYSMYEEQSNLAQNFPKFLEIIDNYINSAGSFLDYRLAVTTTGVNTAENNSSGMDGAFRAGCGLEVPYVQRTDFDVADTFACRAAVGVDGPAVEMPVLATELALSERIVDGTNGDFLRDDALLAVIILTDEDDCASYDGELADGECHASMDDAVAFFDNLKGERSKWALSVIAGETDCTSTFGSADEAVRLKELVNKTGQNGVFNSICEGDLTPALTESIDTFSAACENFGIE
ncbi:MAG: hypothetical protein KJO07_01600 [Deltaproteobacteria bacterium]|nr:hypothetical protein [Deltaproteobacteria bacterium]